MRRLLTQISIFMAILLFSVSGWAQASSVGTGIGNDNGGPKQSWQDIYRNPNLRPMFPAFDVEGRQITYHHLCLAGERVRTKYKHVVTINFTKFIYDYLYTDRVREVERCIEWINGACVAHELQLIEIPLKKPIKVNKKVVDPETGIMNWEEAFEKEYELTTCDDQDKFPNWP